MSSFLFYLIEMNALDCSKAIVKDFLLKNNFEIGCHFASTLILATAAAVQSFNLKEV